jgi:hypothetical protein
VRRFAPAGGFDLAGSCFGHDHRDPEAVDFELMLQSGE